MHVLARELDRAIYRPGIGRGCSQGGVPDEFTRKRTKPAAAQASPWAPARWRAEAFADRRGAAKSGQAEAVHGTAVLQVRRVGIEVALGSQSSGRELAGFEMQRRRGRRVLWATWQGRGEGARRWVGSRRCRGGQVAVQRRRGRPVGGNPRRRRPAAAEQSSSGAGGRRRVGREMFGICENSRDFTVNKNFPLF